MYNISGYLEWIVSLIYIFYVWSKPRITHNIHLHVPKGFQADTPTPGFIIDFLPATRTKHKGDRFPPLRRDDDEMAMNTQEGGNMLGGPVYSGGGHNGGTGGAYGAGDSSSYGSQRPMAQQQQQGQQYYPPQQQQPASRNF